jgi:hypothetical protein
MNTLLLWLVPPLVGAAIGYITNAVAIKMLFRPHQAVRILGLRLPFTPGILPRQRHKLADSIGAMVERELLTADIIRARLREEGTRESVRASIAGYTGRIFDLPLKDLSFRGNELIFFFTETLGDFIKTPAFEAALDRFLDSLLNDPGEEGSGPPSPSIREILGAEDAELCVRVLDRMVRKGLSSAAAGLPGGMGPVFDRNFPLLAESFFRFLNKPEIRGALETQGRIFLNNAIFKLNMLQRFFISAGQYDKTLRERMPEIIDDLIGQMEDLLGEREIRERIRSFALASLQGLLLAEASSAELSALVTGMLRTGLDRPPAAALAGVDRDTLSRLLRRAVSYHLNRERGKGEGAFGRAFRVFAEEHRDMSLGELLSIRPERKEALDRLLCEKLLVLADREISAVLGTINIRTLVSARIDSLAMIDVEHIVLDVMANQLKWINLFGAILGALIGGFQPVFSWFLRGSP